MTPETAVADLPLDEAAEWFWKVQNTEPSIDELKQWNDWLRIERNQRAFDAVTRAWQCAEGLTDAPWPTPAEVANDHSDAPFPAMARDVRRNARRAGSFNKGLAAAAAVALICIGLFVWLKQPFSARSSAGQLQVHETGAAQHRELSLADGSRVFLGAKTSLTVSYALDRRTLQLDRGEALFQVAPDSRRPFVVVAGSGAITAVGTAFNVKRDEGGVVVTVTDGRVVVAPRGTEAAPKVKLFSSSVQLGKGEQVSYSGGGALGAVRHADPAAATAWREGRLLFHGERLGDVVRDLNRYSSRQILFDDSAAEELLFSGTVQQDEVEDWLLGLQDIFPLDVVQTDSEHVLLRSRSR